MHTRIQGHNIQIQLHFTRSSLSINKNIKKPFDI